MKSCKLNYNFSSFLFNEKKIVMLTIKLLTTRNNNKNNGPRASRTLDVFFYKMMLNVSDILSNVLPL